MDDSPPGQLSREQPRQIPVPLAQAHQQRHRSPEPDCSHRSSLPGIRETVLPSTKRFIRPSAAAKNQRCENHTKEGVFTQPGSKSVVGPCLMSGFAEGGPRCVIFVYTLGRNSAAQEVLGA